MTRFFMIASAALLMAVAIGCDNSPAASNSNDTTDGSVSRNASNDAKPSTSDASMLKYDATGSESATGIRSASDNDNTGANGTSGVPESRIDGPSWQALDPSTHQFGTVWVNTVVTHDFRFKNVGTEPLMITKTPRGYCSCSTAGEHKKVIQPGEESVIPYVLTTKNAEGDVHRDLKVTFNDPKKPEWTLYMSGYVKHVCSIEVIADGRVDPTDTAGLQNVKSKKANFDEITADEPLYRVLRLVNTSGHSPLSLQLAPVAGGQFEASLTEVSAGEVYELTIVGSPPYRVGYNNARILFRTNVPERPTWEIPVFCRLPDRIEVSPTKIVVNSTTAKAKTRKITITNNGTTPFKVTAVASSSPEYRLTLLPKSPAAPNESVVEVILPAGDYTPPTYGELIRIETNDAEKPVIELDVVATFGNPLPRPADKPLKLYPGKMLQ